MAKKKYPISKEFFPFNRFAPPMSRGFVLLAQKCMKIPGLLYRDGQIDVQKRMIPGFRGGEIEIFIISPKGIPSPAPCLVNFHGGGFVFEGYSSHYRLAMAYAKEGRCRVIYVRYRLAPAHPFPCPQEDCYLALCWVHEHAKELGVDPHRIAVGGDSAGGTLSAVSCLMARDRGAAVSPLFQMLIYPWLDERGNSDSCRRFTDTPMWNSSLSGKVTPLINPHPASTPLAYRSPAQAARHDQLPPAYIEVAEFDCLHDDGVVYKQLLQEQGIQVEFHEVKGAMHGFDTVFNAPTSKKMLQKRIAYIRRMFQC